MVAATLTCRLRDGPVRLAAERLPDDRLALAARQPRERGDHEPELVGGDGPLVRPVPPVRERVGERQGAAPGRADLVDAAAMGDRVQPGAEPERSVGRALVGQDKAVRTLERVLDDVLRRGLPHDPAGVPAQGRRVPDVQRRERAGVAAPVVADQVDVTAGKGHTLLWRRRAVS